MLKGVSTTFNTDCSFLWVEKQQWWTLLNALPIVSVCKIQIKSNVFIKGIPHGGDLKVNEVYNHMHYKCAKKN
jgi:hypothetical protein